MSDNEVSLNWQTATEKNNAHFLVERMTEGEENISLVTKINGAGNINSAKNYHYIDKRSSAEKKTVLYYRLTQVDKDGLLHSSNPIAINNCSEDALPVIYPNPSTGNIFIKNITTSDNYQVELFNSIGEKVLSAFLPDNNSELDLQTYGKGIYCIVLTNEVRKIQKKLILQ